MYCLDYSELEHLNKLINLNDEQIIEISKGNFNLDINEKIINLLINYKKK